MVVQVRQSQWTFLSNYGHVLVALARDPDARVRDIAGNVGITERAVQQIIGELVEEGYLTEQDPLWADSESTFILNPDAALFTNVVAKAACAADCVAATAGFSINSLFWCAVISVSF